MIMAVQYCEKCKTPLQYILLLHTHDEYFKAALPKQYCPECRVLELSKDDIKFLEVKQMIKNPTLFAIGISLLFSGVVYMVCAMTWK